MKNTIPLIIAVVLAAAAVFAVSRMIRPKESDAEKQYTFVVAAAKPIKADSGVINTSWLTKRRVEVTSAPAKAIPWNQANRVVGQKATRSIAEGDYILLSDIAGISPDFDMLLPEGEWAVPVTFADPALVQFLQPGMEISILGTFTMKDVVEKMDGTEKPEVVKQEATSVIFPCVRILDIGKGDGIRRESNGGSGTIIVALNPQQAATLVAAQRTMDLYPALRRRGDTGSLKRRDVGIVNESTFQNLKKNLETVVIPDGVKSEK